MANFFMRKLIMTVMLALIILRLIEVQADDSPSTPVSHLFKIEDMYKTFSSCLEAKFEKTWRSVHLFFLIVLKVAIR